MPRLAWVVLIGLVSPAWADDEPAPPERPTPFDRGKLSLSAGGGTTSALGHEYYVIGGGVGYFVLDGVQLGLSGLVQFGSNPTIEKVSPSLRYVLQPLAHSSSIVPYVGTFYSHWFVGGGLSDVDTVGGSIGGLYVSGQLVLGLGLGYEKIVSQCTTDCDSFYPDFTIGFTL
jgi:hypothetical protein